MHLCGRLRPSWTLRMLSATVLTASRGPPRPSGRLLGAFLSRLGRAQGVPGGPSEAPKLSGCAPCCLSVSLFDLVRRFRHLWVPFRADFGASFLCAEHSGIETRQEEGEEKGGRGRRRRRRCLRYTAHCTYSNLESMSSGTLKYSKAPIGCRARSMRSVRGAPSPRSCRPARTQSLRWWG